MPHNNLPIEHAMPKTTFGRAMDDIRAKPNDDHRDTHDIVFVRGIHEIVVELNMNDIFILRDVVNGIIYAVDGVPEPT